MANKSLGKYSSAGYKAVWGRTGYGAGNPPPPPPIIWYGDRGVVAGGHKGGQGDLNRIDYFAIASAGNASSFGSLSVARGYLTGVTNTSRACFGGGYNNGTTIDYITVSSTGNATDFGDLSVGAESPTGANDDTRGLFAGQASPFSNVIQYITICLLYTSPSPRDKRQSRMPSSA